MRKLLILAAMVAFSGVADASKVVVVTATESCGASDDPVPTSTDAGMALSDVQSNTGISSNVVTYVTVALTGNAYTPASDGGEEKIAYGTMRAWRYTGPQAGAWDATISYLPGTVVSYSGSLYRSIATGVNLNNLPTDATKWILTKQWTRWPTGDVVIDAYYNPDGGSGAKRTWMSKEIPINIAGNFDRIWFTTENVQTVADAGTISVQVEGQFAR